MTPEKFIHSHLIDCINIVCYLHQNINLFIITGISELFGFTLAHYGSSVLLSTLTPDITASEPRLGTDCWLDFTRQFTLLYDIGLNPSDTVQDMIISVTDLSCLDMFVQKVLLYLIMKLLVPSRHSQFYLTYKATRAELTLLLLPG